MARSRRLTTRAEDQIFLAQRFKELTHNWKAGDACLTFLRGERRRGSTSVERIEGSRVYLADGSAGHISNMRWPL